MYGILRFEKLKTAGNIGGVCAHQSRTRDTPNADSDKTSDNIWLAGRPGALAELVSERTGEIRIRKNGVRAVDVFLGASPEYFRPTWGVHGEYDSNKVAAFNARAMDWLRRTFGAENVVSAVCHLDEATPHIQAVIVPIDQTGKLNASHWFDGKARLSKLQDSFGEAVSPLGLKRGIAGSKSTHTTIQQYYDGINKPIVGIPTPVVSVPPAMVREGTRQGWAEDETDRIAANQASPISALNALANVSALAARRAKEERATAEDAKAEAQAQARKMSDLREQANRIRALDLARVAEALGMEERRGLWFGPATSEYGIKITGSKFYDHGEQKGGGGAIDLAMHVLGVEYRQAVAELSALFDPGAVAADAAATAYDAAKTASEARSGSKIVSAPPAYRHENLESVRRYLVETRGIPAQIVDEQIRAGKVYADGQRNAVFRYGDSGAELRGTRGGQWRGFRGSKAVPFIIGTRPAAGGRLVLVESAIDALSYRALGLPGDAIMAMGGVPGVDRLAVVVSAAREGGYGIVAAFDSDDAGQSARARLRDVCIAARVPMYAQELPQGLKDWNEVLTAAPALAQAPALDDEDDLPEFR